MLRIYTSGEEIHEKKDGNPFVHYKVNAWNRFLIVAHCFGTYWLIIVLNNFNDFVCAAIVVNNYFNTKTVQEISNINILCHCLSHHVGSIAWSVILVPVLAIKLIFGIFDYLLTPGYGKK